MTMYMGEYQSRKNGVDEYWDCLLDLGVSLQTLEIVSSINGYSAKTMRDILYAHTGFNSFDQLEVKTNV